MPNNNAAPSEPAKANKQDAQVDPGMFEAQHAAGGEANAKAQQHPGSSASRRASQQAEDQGLGEGLAHQAAAPRAQGGAHRQFLAARHSARQHEIGDIGASRQQQCQHAAQQHPGRELHFVNLPVAERTNHQANLRA